MATFITNIKFSQQGIKDIDHTTKRAAIFKSEQRLDGFQQYLYVSQALYQTIAAANIKGLGFRPCRSGVPASQTLATS